MGLNLTKANIVVFFDTDFNPQMDKQAQERVYRIGQTKEVFVYRLITENTMEEVILKRAMKKLELAVNLIDKANLSADDETKNMSIDKMLEMIKYGLHKVMNKEGQSDEEADKELLNLDIDTILGKGQV